MMPTLILFAVIAVAFAAAAIVMRPPSVDEAANYDKKASNAERQHLRDVDRERRNAHAVTGGGRVSLIDRGDGRLHERLEDHLDLRVQS